jgi:NAD(P)-dependent dehydrogenase (short-subunit alcohol dehydrogenase family)
VALVTSAFLPLLQASPGEKEAGERAAKVINVSSARSSFELSTAGKLPPTVAVAYSISKTALNALTVEMQKSENARTRDSQSGGRKVSFYAVSPGHLRTAFNGFRGAKEPREGAEVVVRLVAAPEGQVEGGGFWEVEEGVLRRVPW